MSSKSSRDQVSGAFGRLGKNMKKEVDRKHTHCGFPQKKDRKAQIES